MQYCYQDLTAAFIRIALPTSARFWLNNHSVVQFVIGQFVQFLTAQLKITYICTILAK